MSDIPKSKWLTHYRHIHALRKDLEVEEEEILSLMDDVWLRLTEEEHAYLDSDEIPEEEKWQE